MKTMEDIKDGFKITFDSTKVRPFTRASSQERFREEQAQKFREALNALPNRHGGLHGALMGAADYGVMAGLPAQTIHDSIVATGRAFKPGEVEEAIQKALRDHKKGGGFIRTTHQAENAVVRKMTEQAPIIQEKLIRQGGGIINPFDADIWEISNPHPESFPRSGGMDGSECCADMLLFLRELYRPDDLLYIGNKMESQAHQLEHIKTAAAWIEFFSTELEAIRQEPNEREQFYKIRNLGMNYPLIIPNPLSGDLQPLKGNADKASYRGDNNVAEYRYIVVESDSLPLEQQIPLLQGTELPIVAMIFSGSKSIHALVDATPFNGGIPIKDYGEWQTIIENKLFSQLVPLGFDGATKNPSRLSRLPGIWRPDKGQFQRLLYINEKGGALCLTR